MAKYPTGLLEEELKNKVAADWFAAYDTTRIIGKVDFCVAVPATELGLFESENALWAEAKAGVRKDIHESFVQLILTIGRARTFATECPPQRAQREKMEVVRTLCVLRDLRVRYNSPRRRVPFLMRGASSGGITTRSRGRRRTPRTTTSAGISRE